VNGLKISENPDLEEARKFLQLMEDEIITALFKRAHYMRNDAVYREDGIEVPGFDGSYLDFLLSGTEKLHALAGRFEDAGEVPFTDAARTERNASRDHSSFPMGPSEINMNSVIFDAYMDALADICADGDDGEYGWSALADIEALSSISTRVHRGGILVADVKYLQDPAKYSMCVALGNQQEIMDCITNGAQEENVLARVSAKGERYGLDPRFIGNFYRDFIIKATKGAEVQRMFEIVPCGD